MRSLTYGTEWNKKKLLNHISEIVRTVSFYFFKYFRWKINFITAESLYCFRWVHYNFLSVLLYLGRTTGWCFWSPYQISFGWGEFWNTFWICSCTNLFVCCLFLRIGCTIFLKIDIFFRRNPNARGKYLSLFQK